MHSIIHKNNNYNIASNIVYTNKMNTSNTQSSTTVKMISSSSSCSNPPSLPPLYFAENDQNKNNQCFAIEPFPSEVLSTITSFLDWGDYARLSVTNSSFKSIMHDAAMLDDAKKWDLAMALLNGTNGLETNPSLAMKYFTDLAGIEVTKDNFDPSFESMKDIDDAHQFVEEKEGDAHLNYQTRAMKKIAKSYLEGTGVDTDLTLGLAWLKAAHCHGDIQSAYETAQIYEYSRYGVEVDIYHAAEWFLGAANAGHVESMAEYAMCLELGCGVEASDDQALDWYTKAAEKGHITSNFSVGEMFEQARGGVPQSDTEAVLWYYKAALMGDEDSKKALGRLNDIARIVIPGWASTMNV